MSWKQSYASKLTTAEEAVKHIKSGDRVVTGHACGEPVVLIDAMVANKEQYENVEIVHMVSMGKAAFCEPGMGKHFRHNAFFLGASTRKAANEGRADVTPMFFHQVPGFLRNEMPIDVAMIQVCPPDEHGYCSLGISCDYTKVAADTAKTVIAQVNPQMPRTHGDCFVHVDNIDYIVEADMPLIELPPPAIGPVEEKIGQHCASLVNDGDTLQLGIGAIPDAVLLFLKDKKDLGIHSEMISDGVVTLVEAGVITNKRKNLNPGVSIINFLMGTRKLYDYIDDNPAVGLYPADYVNNPAIVGKNDNLISINSCIQVDLMGQVVSTSVGHRQISGVGGQVDFVRGASLSKGGKSIIAMPSTAAKGSVSKIVADIDPGSTVTTSHYDVDYIVTEYGIAHLKGKTYRARARALIEIAHPDFQDALKAEYAQRFSEAY